MPPPLPLHCTHMAACASTASSPLPSRHHTLSLIGVALTAVAVKVLLTETIKGVGNKGEVTTSTSSSDPPPRPPILLLLQLSHQG